ncbi:MAG: hypothetical protein WCK76_13080 [Elusimicrobiota bacterium]
MKNGKSGSELIFEAGVYSREAVELAAYIFRGKCGVKVLPGKEATRVLLDGAADTENLAGELANEALNQQCRIDLARKNSRIAGLIVTKALLTACGEKIRAKAGRVR